jgi:hypothetical protein
MYSWNCCPARNPLLPGTLHQESIVHFVHFQFLQLLSTWHYIFTSESHAWWILRCICTMKLTYGVIMAALWDVCLLGKDHPWDCLNFYCVGNHEPESLLKGKPVDQPDVDSKLVSWPSNLSFNWHAVYFINRISSSNRFFKKMDVT